jgi:hypothetical protein
MEGREANRDIVDFIFGISFIAFHLAKNIIDPDPVY